MEDPAAASAVLGAIRSAAANLAAHPLVGRRVEDDLRELVISYGVTGYIALYRFVVQRDEVRLLALRHQREVGYLP
jgi:plasmid stabilization system protein ParE